MKRAFFAAILGMSLFCSPVWAASDDFASSAIGQELIKIGLRFLDNPGDFFFNLHSDNEDVSPVPSKRLGALRFNFLPTFLPLTWANLNAKVKILSEKDGRPQVDLIGMYGDMLALKTLSSDVEPSFSDYTFGATVSRSMNEKTRLYGGVKYSQVMMNVVFSTPVVSGDFKMSSLDFKISDTFLYTGIAHQVDDDKTLIAQVGYGFNYRKIVARIMISHKHLDAGINIYPEGLFVLHPFIAWHWYF